MSFTYSPAESSSYIVPPLTCMPIRLRWDFEPSFYFYEEKIIRPAPSSEEERTAYWEASPSRCSICAKYKNCPIPEIIKLFEDLRGMTLIIEICERNKGE